MNETSHIAASLVTTIQRLQSEEERHPSRHATELAKLADIFSDIPRENNQTHQTSTQPTAPEIINTAPRVHQRTIDVNYPVITLFSLC